MMNRAFRIAMPALAFLFTVFLITQATAAKSTTEKSTAKKSTAAKAATIPGVNAFLIDMIPDDPERAGTFFGALKAGGANTVILGPPETGYMAGRSALPDVVSHAQKAGLKVFLIVPVRNMPDVLAVKPRWEDMKYDLNSGTIQPNGRLDLFRDEVVDYLSSRIRDFASTGIDGILFGSDLYYDDVEGMTSDTLQSYTNRFNAALVPGRAFARVESLPDGPVVAEYGAGFREWAEMKRDRLVVVIQKIMDDVRAEYPGMQFGLPLHEKGLASAEAALNRFAYDMESFRQLKVDLYWIAIKHRRMRARQGLGYKESMEALARIAQAGNEAVKAPSRALIILQTASSVGKVLPYSEIEKTASLARKGGNPFLAFTAAEDRSLPAVLTKKLFKGNESPR